MAWGKKKKDELSKKRDKRAKTPYRKCGVVYATKRMPNGSIVNLICTQNANVPHRHSN